MDIPLSWHLFVHFSLAILSGYLVGAYFKNIPLGVLVGLGGGFLIDLDHVLEYLLVFNGQFNLQHFLEGRQFLVSDKIHLWFHSWELVPFLLIITYFFRNNKIIKIITIALAFAGAVHLASDVVINQVPLKFYLLSYRAKQGFEMSNLMDPAVYQINLKIKSDLGL